MIKTYCDYCGREIASESDQVNVNIHARGLISINPNEYNFHVSCFERAKKSRGGLIGYPSESRAALRTAPVTVNGGPIQAIFDAGEVEIPLPDEIPHENTNMFCGFCGGCPHTDGTILTSLPPKVRCMITGNFRLCDDLCNVDKKTTAGKAAIADYEKRKAIEAERRKVPVSEVPLNTHIHSLDPSWHTTGVLEGTADTASMAPNMSNATTSRKEVPSTPTIE